MNFVNKIPRWLVIQTDLLVCAVSLILSYFIRHNFEVPPKYWNTIWVALLVVLVVKLGAFLITKSYAGIIKYTSIEDTKRLFYAATLSLMPLIIIDLLVTQIYGHYFIPFGVLLIDYFASIFFMASFRVVSKILYYEHRNKTIARTTVAIFGAGEAGTITRKTLLSDLNFNYSVEGYFDDDEAKQNGLIGGVMIYSFHDFDKFFEKHKIDLLIIAIQQISAKRKQEIVDACIAKGIKVRIIPPVRKWINGELSLNQIKEVSIDDILGRPEIEIEKSHIKDFLTDKVILVTGAAGSIGSELVRQIANYKPQDIILYDQAETPLYDLENEILKLPFKVRYELIVGDISNVERVKCLFEKYKPQIVFHAAAYKHVPIMEDNPAEAIAVNVNGTKVLADLSISFVVEKFVMISTDKAVNPTSVMGASKRVAEIYCQSLNSLNTHSTSFIITRFGNVLGSNGSVIPRFKNQIAEGGPVTITHPEITRFFMTISEAAQLVLEASVMGKGGEIYLFDMGKPIRILDLAKKMIALSGLELGKDIQISFTGLRPGEKLYEELLAEPSNTIKTHHPKILIGKPEDFDFVEINQQITELAKLGYGQNSRKIVQKLKNIIPEYKSQNSTFEQLD